MACDPQVTYSLGPGTISLNGTCGNSCDDGKPCEAGWTLTSDGTKNQNTKITGWIQVGSKASVNVSAQGGDVTAGEAVFSCSCPGKDGKASAVTVTAKFGLTQPPEKSDPDSIAHALITLAKFIIPLIPK